MTEITLAHLTEKKLDGAGVFDVILQTLKLHLDTQYKDNRITGPEYATVYLGQVEQALQSGLAFLAQRQRIGLEAELMQKQIELLTQQIANAVLEGKVLVAQECKLKSEFDYTVQNTLKSTAETVLIGQKTATEKAQVLSLGVDPNSVIGKQTGLYQAQTDGFKRDAEQKAAKLYVDVWSAQRMTDPDATPASVAHGLSPDLMKTVMDKLRAGIGAV